MSENENEYQPVAAGIPVDEEPKAAVEESLYEFDSATFTSGEPAVVVEEPVPTPEPEPETPKAKPVRAVVEEAVATHVVGNGDKDEVYLKQCVYKNMYARKSLTVHHLQRRLAELGYSDAAADRDGWYGDLTKEAVKAFQGDNKLEGAGIIDATTFERIFAGDPNVKVILPE
jgi:hypothetical protein